MNSRFLSLLFVLISLAALPAHGAFLLSDNGTSGNGSTLFGTLGADGRITTGATYSWQVNSSLGRAPGNTYSAIVSSDTGLTKMQDNIGESAGGNYAVYGGYNDATAGASALFDLNSVYEIDTVAISANFDFTSANSHKGVATFEVFTSMDGISFTSLGTWDGIAPSASRNAVISITASALTEARYVQIFASNYNGSGTRVYNSVVLGEMAIFGRQSTAIPEPSTCALLAGVGALGFIVVRRLRRRAS